MCVPPLLRCNTDSDTPSNASHEHEQLFPVFNTPPACLLKRKHDVLDDLKAADILTNLISVPRVGDDDGSAAANASGAETKHGAESPEVSVTPNQGSTQVPVLGSAAPSSASLAPASASTVAPVASRNGILQSGTYPHPHPGMFPTGGQAALPGENGSMPPPEFLHQQANAHAAAAGAAASMARSSVMLSQGIDGLEPVSIILAALCPVACESRTHSSNASIVRISLSLMLASLFLSNMRTGQSHQSPSTRV